MTLMCLLINKDNAIQQQSAKPSKTKKKFPYKSDKSCIYCNRRGQNIKDCETVKNLCNRCRQIGHFYTTCSLNPKNNVSLTKSSSRPALLQLHWKKGMREPSNFKKHLCKVFIPSPSSNPAEKKG